MKIRIYLIKYETLINERNQYKKLIAIYDLMKDAVEQELVQVAGYDGDIEEFTMRINMDTSMKIETMNTIYFRKNHNSKDTKKLQVRNELSTDDDINILYL